ncbi:signal peptidase I [Candidatus Saccharibacteria bacterium]|nr:signal peptidase I [Candidatus Saccharibacteria bacterium]
MVLSISSLGNALKNIIVALVALAFAIFLRIYLKKRKDNKNYSNIAAKSTIIILIASLIVGFNLGLLVGFTRTFFPPIGNTFLFGLLPTIVAIVSTEIIRKIILDNAFNNKYLISIITAAIAFFGISAEINIFTIDSVETGFIIICTIVLPIIAENLLATYLSRRAGITPSLIYRLSRGLYLYILPIAPNFSQYLYSVMWVTVPFLIYILVKRDLPEEVVKRGGKVEKPKSNNRRFSILAFPSMAVLITLTILVSGVFRYKMIAIASNSMSPAFERGDAVVYNKDAELETGDVLAFVHEGKTITHRIVKILEYDTGKVYYTKGDANSTSDNYEIREDSVLGKVLYVVKYIGLPTVLFKEIIGDI